MRLAYSNFVCDGLFNYFSKYVFRSVVNVLRYSSSSKEGGGEENATKSKSLLATEKDRSEITPCRSDRGRLATPKGRNANLIKTRLFKPFESTYDVVRPLDPEKRVIDCVKPTHLQKSRWVKEGFNAYYDVVILGGGIMGCSVAYFLAQRLRKHAALKIAVIEKDPTYSNCTTTRSVGGIRQQFSLPENIAMSLYGADFLRTIDKQLNIYQMDTPNVNFQPNGYLFLASESGADIMEQNHRTQMECGAKVELLSPHALKKRFPWLSTDGIALASYGMENEGWFDPWSLLTAFRLKAIDLGVDFIHGEVFNIAHEVCGDRVVGDSLEEEMDEERRMLGNRVKEAHVHLADGDFYPITSSVFVIAGGPESGHLAYLAGIGTTQEGVLRVPLPVEPRKRFVYFFHAPDGPGLDCPLVIDPSGTYFRREGHSNTYIAGRSPALLQDEPPIDEEDDANYHESWFSDSVWPILAHRSPSFQNLKVKSRWSGLYDYNTWDQNAIIGNHPYHVNVFFATGFSGHGLQQAPAVGRAIMELILDGEYRTIDLSRFSFDRIINQEKMLEKLIV